MSCDCNTLVVGEAGPQGSQGLAGINGTNGTNGINAFTTLSTTFTQPNVYPTSGYDVTITVAENRWVSIGQGIYIQSAGYYTVNSLSGTTQISIRLRQTSGVSEGSSVSLGRKISPSAFAIYSAPLTSLRVNGDLSQTPDVNLDGNVTINDSKNARDLIVKGDTADYLLVTKGSTDRVGINIASPTTTLDVAGTLKASGTVDFGGAVTVNSSNGSNDFIVKTSGPNTTLFVKGNNSRVGIGTTSPDELLHVAGKIKSDTLEVTGGVKITGYMTRGAPVTKTANFTVAESENWLINNKSGSTCIVTLPSASTYSGREITIKTTQAQTVISASSNVISLDGTTTSTAILPATIGKWATLVSNGTNWVIMASN